MTKLFISHSVKDNDFARQLAQALTEVGIDVWIDLADIPAGMKWSTAVQNGLNECDVMIVIITPDSMASNNVEDEWQYYFDKKKKVFPVRWKPADAHYQLSRIQYIDFHAKDFATAFTTLTAELHKQGIAVVAARGELHEIRSDAAASVRADNETKPVLRVEDILPPPFEWVEIPAGKVILLKGEYLLADTSFDVPNFAIAKYPITSAQYKLFVMESNGFSNPDWWNYSEDAKEWRKANPLALWNAFPGDNHPRTNVTWYEAVAFCRWLSLQTSLQITLPTEQEWQRAAIGDTGWSYPWGNEFSTSKCNTQESGIGQTTPVTRYPRGASTYGVMDMSGNVREWCLNELADHAADLEGYEVRSVRGGAWNDKALDAGAWVRDGSYPDFSTNLRGFRIVLNS